MGTRRQFIEKCLRQIYGDYVPDDAVITYPLVNAYLNEGIAAVTKKNFLDNLAVDGIAYVNNGFFTTFKSIAVTKDEESVYKFTLPQIPVALGRNEGIASLKFKSGINVSIDAIPLTTSQVSYQKQLRAIPNKLQYWNEGAFCYVWSSVDLTQYTASVRMASGGDATSLDSLLNVPDDYLPDLVGYIQKQLMIERSQPQDVTNDGSDNK